MHIECPSLTHCFSYYVAKTVTYPCSFINIKGRKLQEKKEMRTVLERIFEKTNLQ